MLHYLYKLLSNDANWQHHVGTGQSVLCAPAWGKSSWILPKAALGPTLSGAENSVLSPSIADISTLVFQATCVPSCMFQRSDYNGQYLHDCNNRMDSQDGGLSHP